MCLDQELCRRIVENLHDGLYLVDRDRVITYWNRAAEKISGFTAGEVVGRSCSDSILTHIDSLVKRADTLLYESKEGGRNRLTMG